MPLPLNVRVLVRFEDWRRARIGHFEATPDPTLYRFVWRGPVYGISDIVEEQCRLTTAATDLALVHVI